MKKNGEIQFKSSYSIDESIQLLKNAFVSQKLGLHRQEGIVGKISGRSVEVSFMYPKRRNAWRSYFSGRFIETNEGACLVGRHQKALYVTVLSSLFAIFFLIFVVIMISELLGNPNGRSVFIAVFSIFILPLIFLSISRLGLKAGREDEERINAALEKALECKVEGLG